MLIEQVSKKHEQERWQIVETLAAIKDVDENIFATDEGILQIKQKWQVKV